MAGDCWRRSNSDVCKVCSLMTSSTALPSSRPITFLTPHYLPHAPSSVAVRFFPGTFRNAGARAALQQEEQAVERGEKRAKYEEGGDLEIARAVGGDAGVQVMIVLFKIIAIATTCSFRCSVRGCLWERCGSHRQRQVTNQRCYLLRCHRHSSHVSTQQAH